MSLTEIRVELPAYSHSFLIQVPSTSSILDVKNEIQRTCPGAPRTNGQRVIWRGRFLGDDERIQDIWTSPDESRVLHLAVHPSAWDGAPPSSADGSQPSPASSQIPSPQPQYAPGSQRQYTSQFTYRSIVPPPTGMPLPFIVHVHNVAIHVLTHGELPSNSVNPGQLIAQRSFAMQVLQAHGWFWPSILDEAYPMSAETVPGVKYERVVIDNQPYLQLTTPDATPSPMQLHALKVLTYTFPLLSVPSPDPNAATSSSAATTPYQHTPATNLNNHLQQLGLATLRLAPNQNVNQHPPNDPNNPLGGAPEIRAIPLRALMVPLMMLTFRTVLLMYFFSPSKRPLFGLILSAWVLYEAWGAFHAVIGNDQQRDNAGARREGGNANPAAPGREQGHVPQPGGTRHNHAGARPVTTLLLDRLASMNLSAEDAILDTDHPEFVSAPSAAHRVKTFLALLLTTLHPAVWDRRRTLLRRREGRVRTEANVRQSPPPTSSSPEGENSDNGSTPSAEDAERTRSRLAMIAKHERRPRWLRRYIERVQYTEWVDDA
ncbi:hypothetical protein K474DRAFT_1657456 [Panus rudis PR-1116 ss-1]|nr:hypothetical protein K474DRAFT_1657456 [Panus rudis PR-1116 ss-1]